MISTKQAASAIARVMRDAKANASKPAGNVSAFTFGPGLEELGITVGGIRSPTSTTVDGPVSPEDAAESQDTPGTSPQRMEPAALAPQAASSAPNSAAAPQETSTSSQPDNQGAPHAKAFDASKGTPYDPLRNKTYDLNYAKTVPALP